MLVVGFRFLAGQYHATPWSRHVNEADIEWPPSPWRIIRTLIATWHRKADRARFPNERLSSLVEMLSEELPCYSLPGIVHTHTRHYMPQFKPGKTSLVFDAFAHLNDDDHVVAAWNNLDLSSPDLEMLDHLLSLIGYLGRSESWVEARRFDEWQGKINCVPVETSFDNESHEPITLLAPLAKVSYEEAQRQLIAKYDTSGSKGKLLKKTLPGTLLEAISLDTADWQKAGWNRPPSARKVRYLRPPLSMPHSHRQEPFRKARLVTTARLVLAGKPLPRLEDALRVGEYMRRATVGLAGRMLGEDRVPCELSGHDLPDNNRHGHAFWLPEDADGDGHIDHIVIYASDCLSTEAQKVINTLRIIRGKEGQEWRVALEGFGKADYFSNSSCLCSESNIWTTVTPWLHPWHMKKRFGIEEQMLRECHERGLPEIANIEWLKEIQLGPGKMARPLAFHRFRTKSGLLQPDTHGSFVRLTFTKTFSGPLALGFGCHFGLGLFVPVGEN